jgi:hypothetical protein
VNTVVIGAAEAARGLIAQIDAIVATLTAPALLHHM